MGVGAVTLTAGVVAVGVFIVAATVGVAWASAESAESSLRGWKRSVG